MTTAQEMLDAYLSAEAAVLAGKTVQFAGRTLTSENLAEIRKGRAEWERRVANVQPGRGPAIGGLSFSTARFDGDRG